MSDFQKPAHSIEEQVARMQIGVHQIVTQQHLVVNVDPSLHDIVPLCDAELLASDDSIVR